MQLRICYHQLLEAGSKWSINILNKFNNNGLIPILETETIKALEKEVFKSSEETWSAMQRVGLKTAQEILNDFSELKPSPENFSVLVLCGKGKNGGDSLLTADYVMRAMPRAFVSVILYTKRSELDPLTERALASIESRATIHYLDGTFQEALLRGILGPLIAAPEGLNLCLDGLLGLGFIPPLKKPMEQLINFINAHEGIDMRASIDLPSGASEINQGVYFNADFCYQAGVPKSFLFSQNARYGRLRFIDIGIVGAQESIDLNSNEYLAEKAYLRTLLKFRPAHVEKRKFGHLFIVGGSNFMPGALLMAVKAAVKSGVGLVTVFAPRSIVGGLSPQVPEAMWLSLPENNSGTIAAEAGEIVLSHQRHATAIIAGPGLGKSRDVEFAIQHLVQGSKVPMLLDADALIPRVLELIQKGRCQTKDIILTPHLGEFLRMTKLESFKFNSRNLINTIKSIGVTLVLKGPITRICDGQRVVMNTRGGPVLSRGGSGDLLAGIIGGQLAQSLNHNPLSAATTGVLLHGLAAEKLAQERGQIMVQTTEVLEYLPKVLR